MKKIIMMVAAVLMFSAPATMAQKIKAESYESKLAKSDEAIANPKKSGKAATWIARGEAYVDALTAPTASLFTSMDVTMLKLTCDEPISQSTEDVKGTTYDILVYPYFKAYAKDGKVAGWKTTKMINEDASDIAFEAYAKAYELDPSQGAKVKEGLMKLSNYYAQIGDISNVLLDYTTGAEAYIAVYDIQCHESYDIEDPMMLYYAGYMYTVAASEDPAYFDEGVVVLNRAVEAGYPEAEMANEDIDEFDKGNIFYYLYHCYYGQKDNDPSVLPKAKETLLKGIEMFPKNQKILDALTQLYTVEEGMGDPSELITLIDNAIAADPSNVDLWFGRGRIYFSLEDYDNCIASFEKVAELAPDVFDGHFYLGLFYIYKGDALNEEISNKTYTANADYEEDIKASNDVYAQAIPVLERAHELKPEDLPTVEYLKSLCFRLRDEDGVMEKYTTYNELFNEMKANE